MTIYHWADQVAERIIKQKGDKPKYVVASGITPSGTVHIGNFREIITVDLVARALIARGKEVRFIYSWDNFDVFRKVPKNMPNQELLAKFLRKSVVEVPDTFDCQHENYARHAEVPVEEILPKVGINPEYIYQAKKYRVCTYADGMKKALENTEKIKEILNKYRTKSLDDSWLPVEIFCEQCGKDTITRKEYKGEYLMYYECACGTAQTFDIREKGIIKLKWRVDWPMRWDYEKVDYEPGGKDHSAAGGSRQTGEVIQKEVYKTDPPIYQMYDWIHIKGGQEFSSSAGVATNVQEVLDIYEPEILRWLFAGSRPGSGFAISFDLDVLKLYEDFDKCERIYFGEHKVGEKEYNQQKRTYELSMVDKPPITPPYQPSFRHLCTVLLIHQGDLSKTMFAYEQKLKNEYDRQRFETRAKCAWNWLNKYAPEDFRYKINTKTPELDLSKKQKQALNQVASNLKEKSWTDKELHEEFYIICSNLEMDHKDFFKAAYKVLINKEKGPQLANFILTIGREKVAELFFGN